MNNIMNTKIRKAYNSYFLNKINKKIKINETTNYKTELTYDKTDEQISSVSVPTLVGRKTLGLCPKVSIPTLVGRKTMLTFCKSDGYNGYNG